MPHTLSVVSNATESRGVQRAAVVAQGHQPLRVVAVDEGHRGDGAGLDHGTAGPGEHQAETATPGQPQVVVLAALVGKLAPSSA